MPFSLRFALTTVLLSLSLLPSALGFQPGFPYGSTKVRGVNLGGWLVLEPWITPSLFDNTGNSKIVDEFTFTQLQSKATTTAVLKQHWDTWITEADFQAIAAAGLNHVRLPVPHYAFDVGPGEPYIQGQLPYIQKAVTWATNNGLKLIIDLHTAPGSQNGFDNSGEKMPFPMWASNQTNVDRTNNIIKTIAAMFKDNTANVPIIAPLNEPAGFDPGVLPVTVQYWKDSYGNIRYPFGSSRQSNTVELIHDAFQPLSFWNNSMTVANGFQGVALDTHIYQMFSDSEVSRSNSQHISNACSNAQGLSTFNLWIIVGEWTPAATDCAKYLNGRGIGARYDGSFPGSSKVGSCTGLTGSASSFSPSYKTFLRQYWEAQTSTYEMGSGWIQWTWKAENADEWSYQAGLANGWIPQNPTNRKYPNICG